VRPSRASRGFKSVRDQRERPRAYSLVMVACLSSVRRPNIGHYRTGGSDASRVKSVIQHEIFDLTSAQPCWKRMGRRPGNADKSIVPPKPALTPPDKSSIAVLPFANLSSDPDQDHFTDGLVDDLITALSRFKLMFITAQYEFCVQRQDRRYQAGWT
jgi:hypothetical protein